MSGFGHESDVERTRIASASVSPRSGYLEPGTRLSSMFQIDAPIARGGMGEVYRGHNIQTGDTVAIKVIKADFAEDEAALDLFKREARALNNLYNEAIVRYYVFAIDPALNRPYLAMELVDGVALSDALRHGAMKAQDVLALARRIGGGLHAAHERHIVHRDVSPDNIIMPGGDVRAAKIIDFGIARGNALGTGTVVGSSVAGKYGYMSPEQANGVDAGPKSDIYSFGLVLAEAARGRQLDMGGSLGDVVRKRMSVPDLSDVEAGIRPLIAAMLAPDPADRPASMQEVANWSPGKPIGAPPPAPPGRSAPAASSAAGMTRSAPAGKAKAVGRSGVILGAAVALAAALGAGGYFAFSGGGARNASASAPPGQDIPRQEVPRQEVPRQEVPRQDVPRQDVPPALVPPPPRQAEPAGAPAEPPAQQTTQAPEPPASSEPQQMARIDPSVPPAPFAPPVDDLTPVPGGRIEEMAAFVRDWRGGECVAVRALTLAAASAQLEGVATSAQPFESVNEAFKAKFGFEPEIGGWLIGPPQCAVTQFLAKARLDPAAAPRLELGAANLRSGQHLTGLVEAPPGRQIEVWQISDAGEASNITALVRSAARSFNLRIERAGSGGGSKPQIIIAFASAQPLTALRLARPAPAEKALPAVLAESQTRNLPLGVTIRVFNVE